MELIQPNTTTFTWERKKVTTLFWRLLQRKVDERPLEEATCRGATWPLNALIGGIWTRRIPVAKASLADLDKVCEEYPWWIYGEAENAAHVWSLVQHWQMRLPAM